MAYEITLPRLGWDMEEGSLAGWLKNEGEFVNAGDLLFSVEGDKAVQEIEALDSGFLRILPSSPQPGEKVAVGTLIGYLVPQEEIAGFRFPGEETASIPEIAGTTESPVQAGISNQEVQAAPTLPPSNGESRRIYISPFARRLAEGLGVDWRAVKGSGRGGRIMALDVEAAAALLRPAPPAVETKPPMAKQLVPPASPQPAAGGSRQRMSPFRKKIAEQMARSAHTAAPVTLTMEVDATELVALRKALKEDAVTHEGPVPSYNDLLAKLAAQALLEHPLVNARLEGDEIVQTDSVHIAIAVDTDRGLLVPVLRDVHTKTLRTIARESAVLIEKTRSGTIAYEDLQGATFTITNLGMFEIDAFTPIIDVPQCAILGVGRIVPKQVVVDYEKEQVAIRLRMFLSLTFDHRLVDGAQAARFLQRIKRFVEQPYLWMAG